MLQGRGAIWLALASLFISHHISAKTYPAVPGEYVVTFKQNVRSFGARKLSAMLNATSVQPITKASGAYLVRRSPVETAEYSMQSLKSNALVEIVEPNYIYTLVGAATALPNDPNLKDLWGMVNTGQATKGDDGGRAVQGVAGVDIDAQKAWMIETGSRDFKIAVVDTGVGYNIEDLKENIWNNDAEINGKPGVDDDNNGCVDDFHGCNFTQDTATGDPLDDHGHGSHVSGTIGASGDNGIQIVGVAWKATIVGVKFLDSQGSGTLANAIRAIDYATKVGVRIMSNSWGGGGFSQTLMDSISRAKDAGILFVAAAGNEGNDNDSTPSYPASYQVDNIISVAAIDAAGNLADFSCYGAKTVHVAAPGVNIMSITPTGLQTWSGTSMATPHVTGIAALLMSQHPEQTYTEIKNRILAGARPLAALRGKVATGGLANAYYSLTGLTPPADPNDASIWPKVAQVISTDHPYANSFKASWTVNVPKAVKISLHFTKFETEANFDVVTIKDAQGNVVAKMSGTKGDVYSPVITGDTAVIEFASDNSVTAYGFDLAEIAYQLAPALADNQ